MSEPILVSLSEIKDNPYQPRTAEDVVAIQEIAINIYRNGLMQIPSARAVNPATGSGQVHYELVFGHTRKAAYKLLATKGVPSAGIDADPSFGMMPVYVRELNDRQMFEMAVAENIKRRDLNSIETASALQTYMKDFNATSKEAGELFGLNESTVRGKVRLLELPKEAQEKLAAGEISEGTARSLLSMQKVASEKNVIKAVNEITSNPDILPDQIIEMSVDRLKDVVDMWSEQHRDGKPRGGYHLWLLDMKNFPNKQLPALTYKEVIDALKAEDNPKLKGLVKESLSFYDLLEKLKNNNDPDAEKIEHLLNPPACTACPFYTKVRGSHYCGMKICHDRKTVAWQENIIQDASKNLKIPVYASSEGSYSILGSWGEDAKLFSKRHKNLRLLPKQKVKGYAYQPFPGVDDDHFVVVIVGKRPSTETKATTSNAEKKQLQKEKTLALRREIFIKKRDALIWESTIYFGVLFDGFSYDLMSALCNASSNVGDIPDDYEEPKNNAPESVKLTHLKRVLVADMLGMKFDYVFTNKWKTLVQVATSLEEVARAWKVKLPKSVMKMAEQGDLDIKSVSVETKAKK